MLPSAGVSDAEALAEQHRPGVALGERLAVDELEVVDLRGRQPEDGGVVRSQARAATTGSSDVARASTRRPGGSRTASRTGSSAGRRRRGPRGRALGGRGQAAVPRASRSDRPGTVSPRVDQAVEVDAGPGRGRGGDRRELGEPRDERGDEQGASGEGAVGPAGARAGDGEVMSRQRRRRGSVMRDGCSTLPLRIRRPDEPSGWIVHILALPSCRCERSDDSPSVPSCPSRWPPWATWRATCAGPGTRRRRTSSRPSTPSCGSPPATTRSGCSAPWTRARLEELAARRAASSSGWPRPRADLDALPHRRALVPARRGGRRPAGDRATSRRSTASPPCCRSTPAASASSPATTSRRPATSASRSSASGCSTGTATSSSRSPARAGSRRPTRSSTPTSCRSSLLREADGSRATSRSRCPAAPTWWPGSGSPSVGRVPLLLLDTDVEENPDHFREVTDRLYGGTSEHRLRQELLLGVGGVRALRAYSRITGAPEPEVFHTNEGHAGFLGLERIRELIGGRGRPRPRLRHRARGSRALDRLHHAHAGPGRHRPVPPRAGRAVLRRRVAGPGRPRRADPRARRARTTRAATRASSTWP